ncbi:MAG: ybhO [Panacagrimonas sp.]|jgi:cardiolipin synthase|nr:cardiolipin synthase ClsB [Panacagrimonas sp.]MCC2658099.1 ybhO [Panacagrimonas sp.]
MPLDDQPGNWTYGNRVRLLENGEEYYPAVFGAIARAEREVLLETFLIFDDEVGQALKQALIDAARRGVKVVATADHYGAPDLSREFVAEMIDAGVDFRYFDPKPRVLGMRTNMFKRLHRKIVVVDQREAYVGGINYSIDHLRKHGPESKQDYAVQLEGPIVGHFRELVLALLELRELPRNRPWWRSRVKPMSMERARSGGVPALATWRDNDRHQDDIEIHYRAAIRQARSEVLIANAYFFPGYRLVREMRRAARRGVKVRLVLQGGAADKAIATWAARSLYRYLARAGVCIYEYCERPLHGKVAVIDDAWCTVGSSNLDPSSLSLNLEANVIIWDRAFAAELKANLERLISNHCLSIESDRYSEAVLWRRWAGFFVFHLIRIFPYWDRWLPQRKQPVLPAPVALEVAPPPEPPATNTT